jgi:hypothetical protein
MTNKRSAIDMQYTVAEKMSAEELTSMVRVLISDGWIPLGGVSTTTTSLWNAKEEAVVLYSQAMIKESAF